MSSAGVSRHVAADSARRRAGVDDDVGGAPALDEGDLVVDAPAGGLLADLGGEDATDVGVADDAPGGEHLARAAAAALDVAQDDRAGARRRRGRPRARP